ncbi:hypothetical protein WS62_22900 [Burkholderia sp. ABCPW 14]|nr:hypothetical protein WS62_22900 [Burkholderia sp. ABCPW 14]
MSPCRLVAQDAMNVTDVPDVTAPTQSCSIVVMNPSAAMLPDIEKAARRSGATSRRSETTD